MTTGVIRSAQDDGSYINDIFCHTQCKFNDPDFISTRDTGILGLFSFGGISRNRVYEVRNSIAPTTRFDVMAPVAAGDTTIQFAPEAQEYLDEEGKIIVIGTENIEIVSVDATGLATVVRGPNAAAYTTGNFGFIIGKPTNFCESANCTYFSGKCVTENSFVRTNYCVETCKEELCEEINFNPDCDDSSILDDEVNKNIRQKALMATRDLNRMALHSQYRKWTSTVPGKTRGLIETAFGVPTDVAGKVLTGVLYDAGDSADNSCSTATNGDCIADPSHGYRIIEEFIEKVDAQEGTMTHVIINNRVKNALKKVIYQCETSCDSTRAGVNFSTLDRLPGGTLGDLIVVEDNSMPDDLILFVNEANLKMFGHCSSNGSVQEFKTKEDDTGFFEKYESTIKVAFDATENMCSDLGAIHNFKIDCVDCS